MGCSPPPARNGSPVVLAGSCGGQTGWVTGREGTGGGRGMQVRRGRGDKGRSPSRREVGSRSA